MISRPMNTTLSILLLSLGVGMISLLLQASQHIQNQMENNIRGIDMVVGAKGSPLQLILSSVYHIDVPTGNIDLKESKRLQRHRLVDIAIPLSYGDTYEGYRIVGSDYQYPQLYEVELAEGRLWKDVFEVSVGATVAKNLGINIGDNFVGSHGLSEGGETHDEHAYKVVGILAYSNSVIDQLILTSTESVWKIHDHEEEEITEEQDHEVHDEHDGEGSVAHNEEEDEERQVTAMLVKFKSPLGMIQLPRLVNESTNMQAAVPAFEINRLFSLMGVGIDTLKAIAIAIMVVSGLSVFISLYGALNERRYEMALMRTYGGSRWQLLWLVVQEGLLLTLIGFVLGILLSRLGMLLMSYLMEANYHYDFSGWNWLYDEAWLFIIALLIGLSASLVPAIRAFYINISKTLSHA